MESSPYYLPAPYSKGLGISVPTRDRSISGNLNRISVFSFADQKPTRLSLDSPSFIQSPSEKVISQMKTTSKKFLDKMNEIDQNIANNKLPFIKYYIPGTETFKSKKEISHEIHTSHDFFKSDQSLFKGSKYKPKDFCYCSPRSKSKTPYTPRQILSTQQFELRTPSENQESRPSAHHAQLSPSHLSPMAAREAYMLKKLTVHDQDEGKVSPNISSTHYTSLEMAPSAFQIHPVEKIQHETEEMVLVQYNKGKIPLSLYEGTVMRRKLIKDIKGGNNNNSKILEKQGTAMVKKDDIKQKPSTADSLNISISGLKKNAEEKQRRLGKADMITRSPVTNVYYQVLSMTTPNKKAIAAKLKINPNLRRDEIRAERNL